MKKDPQVYIEHIIESIDKILKYTHNEVKYIVTKVHKDQRQVNLKEVKGNGKINNVSVDNIDRVKKKS